MRLSDVSKLFSAMGISTYHGLIPEESDFPAVAITHVGEISSRLADGSKVKYDTYRAIIAEQSNGKVEDLYDLFYKTYDNSVFNRKRMMIESPQELFDTDESVSKIGFDINVY